MITITIFVAFILLFVEMMLFKLNDTNSTLKDINKRLKAICVILENEREDG